MTIHYALPPDETDHVDLGRVLVTIDSLERLMSLVADQGFRKDDEDRRVAVGFNGGFFTDAGDLVKLSDDEIRDLRIDTPLTQVALGEYKAMVYGHPEACAMVYKRWAKKHQVPRRRRRVAMDMHRPLQVVSSIAIASSIVACVLSVLIAVLVLRPGQITPADIVASAALGLLAGLPVLALLAYNVFGSDSFAVIVPVTMAKYRESRASSVLPRRGLIVAVISAVASIAAVIVTIVTAK